MKKQCLQTSYGGDISMVLSNDLISQFVKATNDKPAEVKESIVYGTAECDADGNFTGYVKLDGSDVLTPVTSTTVVGGVKQADGKIIPDRVTVMIKNHKATITGNVSNPSARLVDTLSVDKLDAVNGEIDNIKSSYATIESLDVLKESVNLLNADIANIDTLIFGSASGDVIQTSFANAVIAQLGDAQIKSAMIKDIVTNDVEIKSEDGKLLISDETIQISDDSRVRVQIGKDASNDYSINVWDRNGNLIFNNAGITDKAIADGLIRNNMISDTANISSSKIYLDEENQTLDVAFKSMSDDVSSQGTAISVMQGQISSKIWQQDINTATNEMSTQYSTLEQDLNGFKTTVNNTTSNLGSRMSTVEQTASGLTAKIDGLEIGGRNYFRPSQTVDLGCTGALNSATLINTGSCVGFYVPTVAGDVWSISRSSVDDTNRFDYGFTIDTPAYGVRIYEWNAGYRDKTKIEGIVVPEGYNYLFIYLSNQNDDASSVKLEFGNKATDWTPAPEDVNNDISNASKTATNYMNFSSNGLVIGDLTASMLGKNALIDTDGFKVRTGTTVNSFFGADIIELAKNNESAVISMLNGTFKIYYSSNTSEAGLGIYGKTSTGEERLAFQPVNENDNLTIGWGGYNAGKNGTNIYGHNMKLIAGNDMSIENDRWQINIDGNLFGKASNSSFVELIGLSSDDNTTIGHGGFTAAMGKTNIYGNKIQHIVNTKSGSSSYKPYYEAGDSFETEWYGAGFISSSSKVVYFSIPLAKPIIGNTTPTVKVTDAASSGGLQIRQDSNYVFGSTSSAKVSPSSYSAKVVGDGNFVQIEATMANATNAINNAACGINAKIKITFS
jgi:hypothetical protein